MKNAVEDPRMIMLRMTVEIGSAVSLLQHGANLLAKASVTTTALRGTSQPGTSSAKTNLVGDTTLCVVNALTPVNATQPMAPWQASVASERPQLSRRGGDLVDEAKYHQEEEESRQCCAR